jgi:hypothetical protein
MCSRSRYGALLILAGLLASRSFAQVSVLTQHNDNSRTGQNLQETTLNTTNVNVSTFGKLFSLPVDGNIYAQPLYLPNLAIAGETRNVVYTATANNTVYAFDADSGNTTPLWSVNLGTPVPAQDICVTDPPACPYTDVIPVIGIVATPVIDTSTGTIYVVAKTKDSSGNDHFKLHALDLVTGGEKFAGPTEITASGFTAFTQLNRPGLLLANGMVYVAFGSEGDFPTWHGWVMAYDASTLQQVAVYCSTPQHNDVGGAGIWETGNGLVADSNGDIYAITSNGNFDVNTGGQDYGSAYLKLSGNALSVMDYFVPYNQASLNPESDNVDLGSGGAMLIPNTTLLVGGGKDSVLRVVDTSNMGKYNGVSNTNHQNIPNATPVQIFGSPVYWNSPNLGALVYLWGSQDFAKAWSYNAQSKLLSTSPVMKSTIQGVANTFYDHAPLSISADGNTAGTGILWASMPYSGDANGTTGAPVPGALYALDATDLAKELWDSQMNSARDSVGNYAKFVPPTVVNGKVYLATFSGELVVYGTNPPSSSQVNFVQANYQTPQAPTSSVSVKFNSAQTQGNLNIVVVGWADTTTTIDSVMDDLGNQYSVAAALTRGTGLTQAVYYAKDILGGTNSVHVAFSKSASFPDVRILEYSGADATSPLDQVASASGNSATANSGSVTTTVAKELIFGANTVWTGNQGPGASFTTRIITSPNSDLAEDRSVVTTGSYSASATLTSSGPWVMQMVTLKAGSGGGGGSAPTVSSISPNTGSSNGGTSVTIKGTNFASGSTVTFGGTAASNVTVVSSTSITAATPAHAAGAVNVVVSDSNGSGTLTNGFTYTAATVTIGFVQVASATPQSSVSSVKVSYPHTQTAGDLNVLVVGWNDTSAAVQSVVDSLGNAYVLAAGPIKGTALTQAIYYAKNIAGGSNSVTVTFNKAAAYPDIRILEYKGLSTTAPVDVTAGASGTSGSNTTVSSGAVATTANNELIFGAGMTSGGYSKAGSSFKAEVITQDGSIAEDEVVSQTGRYGATATLGAYGSQAWVMQMVTFKQ